MRLITSLGDVPLKIIVDKGELLFYSIEDSNEILINEALNFGTSLIGQQRTQKFLIKNPNHFDIVVKSVLKLHYCSLRLSHIVTANNHINNHNTLISEYPQPNYLFTLKPGFTAYFELKVSILPTKHLPLEFVTSSGKFSLKIAYNPVSGSALLYPVYFSEILPGIIAYKKIELLNLFPIEMKILGVETDLDIMEAQITKRTIPPNKEIQIGTIKVSQTLYKDEIIVHDFNKYPTHGFIRI